MYELAHIHKYDSRLFWDGRNTELNNHWFVVCAMNYEDYDELYEYLNLYVNPALPSCLSGLYSPLPSIACLPL